MTGSLGDALQAGTIAFATAKAFEAVGNHREMGVDSAGNTIYRSGWEAGSTRTVLAHGAVGGLSAKASGGQFRQGFMSSGFSAAMGPSLPQGNTVAAYASRMAVGGTASRLAGGSFANGAKTAAYGYMFNDMMHAQKGQESNLAEKSVDVLSRTLTTVGGGGQVLFGGALCTTIVGCTLGAPIATLGASNIQEGITGQDGFARYGFQFLFGENSGDWAFGAVNLGTSIGGLARPVLKHGIRPLFRTIPRDFEPAFRQATSTGLTVEGVSSG